jgi:UDP-2-acetamido-2-deoxy-ribo-hexuluronate aminotransferase
LMEFVDLQAQRARISDEIDAGIRRVLDHGRFISGPEVAPRGSPRKKSAM